MMRASSLLLYFFIGVAMALLGEKLERRSAPVPHPGVELPARWPVCARLQPMAGRVDIVVIDHVLVYRCART